MTQRKIVGLIDTPGLIGWLEMTAQPLLQFVTVALDPALDCRVVCLQAALAEQLFDIAERERVPQVPAHGTKNQLGLGLSPLEDRRSDCLFHDLFRLPASVSQSCNTTFRSRPRRGGRAGWRDPGRSWTRAVPELHASGSIARQILLQKTYISQIYYANDKSLFPHPAISLRNSLEICEGRPASGSRARTTPTSA